MGRIGWLFSPITVISLAVALMIGDGCAAFLSLCQGKKDLKSANKSVGNALTLLVIIGIVMTALFAIFKSQILLAFGATENNFAYASEYFNFIIMGIAAGSQPVIGYNYGAREYKRVRELFSRKMQMRKLGIKKSIILATACCLLFGTVVIAALPKKATVQHTTAGEFTSYSDIAIAEQIALDAQPAQFFDMIHLERAQKKTSIDGIEVRYYSHSYKCVPLDYDLTEDDIRRQK